MLSDGTEVEMPLQHGEKAIKAPGALKLFVFKTSKASARKIATTRRRCKVPEGRRIKLPVHVGLHF